MVFAACTGNTLKALNPESNPIGPINFSLRMQIVSSVNFA